VHFPASFSSIPAQMNAMADLVAAGKIRAVGVSNFSARQMRRAHEALAKRGLVLGSNQVKYSLLDRRIEDNGILQAARELGVTVIAYSPLEMGLLSGKFHKDPAVLGSRPLIRRLRLGRILDKSRNLVLALERIAAAHGASAAQVALNWVTGAHGETVVAIPGASTAEQARECAGAMNITLSPEEMAEIDGLSRRCAAKG
jgi:aryl-alcohol dehydrogenase-like predicted oxidoreductase